MVLTQSSVSCPVEETVMPSILSSRKVGFSVRIPRGLGGGVITEIAVLKDHVGNH